MNGWMRWAATAGPAWLMAWLCAGCGPQAVRPAPAGTDGSCMLAGTELKLLGVRGDSPLVAVSVHGEDAAMFFSPGFAPLLLRRNGDLWFPHGRSTDLLTQDGGYETVWTTAVRDFAIGPLEPQLQAGLVLPGRDTRSVDGRPIIGMIGRQALAPNAVVDLDIPRRRAVIAVLRNPRCPAYQHLLDAAPLVMQSELLRVEVSINGHPVQAVLEPDLPISVIPRRLAAGLGVGTTGGASVRTMYGERVRGTRQQVGRLTIGRETLADLTFDVEDQVDDVMLGLNVLGRGEAVFDLEQGRFWFHVLTDTTPPPGALHFDETKVAHTQVQ